MILKIKEQVENNSNEIEKLAFDIIKPYCADLDMYITFIKDCLKDGENPPTDAELDDFCLNLSTYLYFAGGMCEQLGIRDDMGKALYKETYNETRSRLDGGTVADKDSIAELNARKEYVVSSAYTRAYKMMKSKIENGQELLQSVKKVISRRCLERELTKIGGSGK